MSQNNFAVNQTYTFTYRDQDGVVTIRTVTVEKITETAITGRCHNRNAYRSFRYDRMITS